MRYKIVFYLLMTGLTLGTCTESKESKKRSYEEEEKIIEQAIEYKYSSINTLEKLNIALEIYMNENIILKKEELFEKVSNHTYDINERIYLIKLYDHYAEEYPNIVIPRLVSLGQYCGVATSEYLWEYLGSFFWENPREFILAMNKDSIAKYIKIEADSDSLIAHIYKVHSEPLSKDYYDYEPDEYKNLIIARIKGLDIENDFYLYLKNKYKF